VSCPPSHAGDIYELRVDGHLDQHWSSWFGDFSITHNEDGTSTLRGTVTDQSHLHGLLAKVRDLAVGLISVTPVEQVSAPTQHQPDAPNL
jgi:hypothetical protein